MERRTTLTRGGRVPFTTTVAPYLASYRYLTLTFFESLCLIRACAVALKFALSSIALISRPKSYLPVVLDIHESLVF